MNNICLYCGTEMILSTNGYYYCPNGCTPTTTYTTKYALSQHGISKCMPYTLNITVDKITITERSTNIKIDVPECLLDNIDVITINGVKYVKEN